MADTDRWKRLEKELANPDSNVRSNAAWRISAAAVQEDISPLVPALWKTLQDPHNLVDAPAAAALARHYLIHGEWDALPLLLEHERERVRRGADEGFRNSSMVHRLLNPLYLLRSSLSGEKKDRNWFAARERDMVRLAMRAFNLYSVFDIAGLQKGVETFLLVLQKILPRARTPDELDDRIKFQHAAAVLFQRIAERKAKLAKKGDGVLLAGETIARPKGKTGVYAAVRRRN